MAAQHKESPDNNPGLHATPDEATKGYLMQLTVSLYVFLYDCGYLKILVNDIKDGFFVFLDS